MSYTVSCSYYINPDTLQSRQYKYENDVKTTVSCINFDQVKWSSYVIDLFLLQYDDT